MAYVPTRTATTGELISGTFEVLMEARREIGLYVAVFAALGLALSFELIESLVSLAAFLLYFPAQYWLCQQMFTRSGMRIDNRYRVFSFFGMAMVLGFAIMVGFNFFWIPGILLGAKWVMAPSYLVAEDGNMFDAIGNAWRASDGSTLSVSLAYTAIGAIGLTVIVLVISVSSLFDTLVSSGTGLGVGPVAGMFISVSINVLPIMMMALSVAAYRLLSDQMEDVTEVFA